MPIPSTQNCLPRSLTTPSIPANPVRAGLGSRLPIQEVDTARQGAARTTVPGASHASRVGEELTDPKEVERRRRKLLTSSRWRRENTVFKMVNYLATQLETRVYLMFQHEGEEKVHMYNSHPDKECITDFKYLMEFKYPRPHLRTPETMAETLATKLREREARLPRAAEQVPDQTLCDEVGMLRDSNNEDRHDHSMPPPALSSPVASSGDTEMSSGDDLWAELDAANMCDWYDGTWENEAGHIDTDHIDAGDINAGDINTGHIDADHIEPDTIEGMTQCTQPIHNARLPETPTPQEMPACPGHPQSHPSTATSTPSSTQMSHAQYTTSRLQPIMESGTKHAAGKPNALRPVGSGVRKARAQGPARSSYPARS